MSNIRDGTDSFELALTSRDGPELTPVALTYRADAQVFMSLYKNMAQWPEDKVLTCHVFPLIGEVVMSSKPLRDHTITLLRAHMQRYGNPVGDRIRQDLLKFDLVALVPSLADAEQQEQTKETQ